MKLSRTIRGIIVVGSLILVLSPAADSSDKTADDARAYQAALETLRSEDMGKIRATLEEWKFQALDSWVAENPTPKEIGRHNRTKVKFSKQEITEIFGLGGKFKVLIYTKLVGTDRSNIGEIDGMGMSLMKDAQINLEQYCVIRVVFKDGKMIHFRIWPKLEQSGFSGGTWLRR